MKHLTHADFQSEVTDFKGVVLVDFYAEWCGPCKVLGPMIEKLDKEIGSAEVKITKVNVDEESELASQFGVMSIPTVIVFKDGKLHAQQVGVGTEDTYKDMIQKAKSA